MSVVDAVNRPTTTSSVVSVVAVTVVVGLVLPSTDARVALVGQLVGVGVVAGGLSLVRRSHRITGSVVTALGGVTVVGAAAFALSVSHGLSGLIVTLPGVVGVPILALALAPVYGTGSRTLVKVGTGAVFVAVLVAGLFRYVTLQTLLVAGVGTIAAWDAGERAISVGEQLGRVAETRRLEAVHGVGTLLVGSVAVGAGVVVAGVGSPGLPLSALAALLVAVLLLTAALHG